MVQDTTRLSDCLQYWLQVRTQADKAAMGADSQTHRQTHVGLAGAAVGDVGSDGVAE